MIGRENLHAWFLRVRFNPTQFGKELHPMYIFCFDLMSIYIFFWFENFEINAYYFYCYLHHFTNLFTHPFSLHRFSANYTKYDPYVDCGSHL